MFTKVFFCTIKHVIYTTTTTAAAAAADVVACHTTTTTVAQANKNILSETYVDSIHLLSLSFELSFYNYYVQCNESDSLNCC